MRFIKNHLLIVIALFISTKSYCTEDCQIIKKYNNVIIRIKSFSGQEEINRVLIIGKLVEKLAKDLDYNKTIFLDFDHDYVKLGKSRYYISYDDGKRLGKKMDEGKPEKKFLKTKSIVIRQYAVTFDCKTTLKLVEYAIKNISEIEKTQKPIPHKSYYQHEFSSINNSIIKAILDSNNSDLVNELLNEKIFLKYKAKTNISYYIKNDFYNLFYKNNNKIKVVKKLKSIQRIISINPDTKVIFIDNFSFYCINKDKISKIQNLPKIKNFNPYNVKIKNKNQIVFYCFIFEYSDKFSLPKLVQKNYIYSISKNEIID